MTGRVIWRGATFDPRTRDMLVEVARITPRTLYVRPSQGSFSTSVGASAGTHAGGGAVDLSIRWLTPGQRRTLLRAMRRVGFAAWIRTPSQGPWPMHLHAVAVQPGGRHDKGVLSTAAFHQVEAYYTGRNGLANNHADDGPRDWVGQTWEKYRR